VMPLDGRQLSCLSSSVVKGAFYQAREVFPFSASDRCPISDFYLLPNNASAFMW